MAEFALLCRSDPLYAIFRVAIFALLYVGFSAAQTIVLSLIFLGIYTVAEDKFDKLERDSRKIAPFSVTVRPHWYVLLRDTGWLDEIGDGAVQNEEQFYEHFNQTRLSAQTPSDYDVMRHGISFTLLSHDLIYSNNHHDFRPFSALSGGMREFLIPDRIFGPGIYVKWWRDQGNPNSKGLGLEIGVNTPRTRQKPTALTWTRT